MKKLKIAMVAACPFPAAFASSGLIRELSLALTENGHEIHVVTYHLGRRDFAVPGLNIHRIAHFPWYRKHCSGISPGKPVLDFFLTLKLLEICRKYPIDIIHAHNYEAPPAAYFVRYFHKIPVVYHAHNTMYHELPTYFKSDITCKSAEWIGRVLDAVIPRRADAVIALSKAQKVYLLSQGVSAEKLRLIFPGIYPELLADGDPQIIRQKLGLENEPLLIYTGGLQPYQNCESLVPLLRSVIYHVRDAHLLIVARSESHTLQSLAMRAGIADRIHFLQGAGLAWEKNCLAAADIAIIPRLHCIGFPIKLLNYLAASKPVVCFQSISQSFDPVREVWAVETGNYKAMADAIVCLLNNRPRAEELSRTGQQAVIMRHNIRNTVSDIENIYQKLLKQINSTDDQ